jgi:hypothetical protein
MAKRKARASSRGFIFFWKWVNFFWGALAAAVWGGEQIWHSRNGTPFSSLVFLKGLLLILAATAVYQFSAAKKFSFLGFFPLLWLSASKFQWDLCDAPETRYWLWLAVFLAVEVIILALPDGKKLLPLLTVLWACLIWLFPFSFLLPLTFITAPSGRFKRSEWARWGGLLAGIAFFILFHGWKNFYFQWLDVYELFIPGRYAAFFLLGLLGLIAFPRKGIHRHVVFPLVFLTLGFLLWTGPLYSSPLALEVFKWVLVFFAGFGWESFRRDLMDDSWHGKAVWFAMGAAFFGGVL